MLAKPKHRPARRPSSAAGVARRSCKASGLGAGRQYNYCNNMVWINQTDRLTSLNRPWGPVKSNPGALECNCASRPWRQPPLRPPTHRVQGTGGACHHRRLCCTA